MGCSAYYWEEDALEDILKKKRVRILKIERFDEFSADRKLLVNIAFCLELM